MYDPGYSNFASVSSEGNFHLPRDFLLLLCLVLPLYFNYLLITCDVYNMFQAFDYIGE